MRSLSVHQKSNKLHQTWRAELVTCFPALTASHLHLREVSLPYGNAAGLCNKTRVHLSVATGPHRCHFSNVRNVREADLKGSH